MGLIISANKKLFNFRPSGGNMFNPPTHNIKGIISGLISSISIEIRVYGINFFIDLYRRDCGNSRLWREQH